MVGTPGRSGRKPKPVERKIAAGNPGKRALNRAAPQFGAVVNVDTPDWLTDEPARDLWRHLTPLLCAQQVLQATDIQNLELYCVAYGNFRRAVREISLDGITVDGKKNSAATVLNEAMRQMATFGALLGLDPSSRQRLLGPPERDAGDELKAILEM